MHSVVFKRMKQGNMYLHQIVPKVYGEDLGKEELRLSSVENRWLEGARCSVHFMIVCIQ